MVVFVDVVVVVVAAAAAAAADVIVVVVIVVMVVVVAVVVVVVAVVVAVSADLGRATWPQFKALDRLHVCLFSWIRRTDGQLGHSDFFRVVVLFYGRAKDCRTRSFSLHLLLSISLPLYLPDSLCLSLSLSF